MKKNKISKNWVNKQRRDTYVRQSKVDGYRARSAYKLIEIDEKFKIFKGGISVIDIGAAPGSWSQYAAKTAKSGRLISIDLKEMEPIGNTVQIQGDFTEESIQDEIKKHIKDKIDVVMSDMAVNTTGIKNIDSIQTGELCKEVMIRNLVPWYPIEHHHHNFYKPKYIFPSISLHMQPCHQLICVRKSNYFFQIHSYILYQKLLEKYL